MKKKVINPKYLPAKLPILSTAVWYLLLEHFKLGNLWWGITGTLMGLIWILCIYAVSVQKFIDID